MTNTSAIKKDFYKEQDKNFKDKVNVASSPFRYNTPYSNLTYEDANKCD